MNRYRYGELYVGQKEQFCMEIKEDMLGAFCRLTGDDNPLHTDRAFACGRGFPDRVVYGMLTASLLSTLGGVYLPGERCLIHSVEVKFLRPVFSGDTLQVEGTVAELHDTVQQVVLKVEIHNQSGTKVLRGKMKIGMTQETEQPAAQVDIERGNMAYEGR